MAVLWTLLLVIGLLAPAVPLPASLPSWLPWPRGAEQPSYLDKLIHAVLFLVETRLLAIPGVVAAGGRALRRAIAIALVLAAATELLQAPIPTRSADLGDFLANLLGIAVGAYLGRGGQTR